MKKQLFLSSALALVTLASCGSSKTNWYKPGTKLKVGLICLHDKGTTYDKNFIDAFEQAMNEAKSSGKVSDYLIKTNIAENQACADAATQLVNQGCNIIFSDSFGHDEFMYATAKEHPEAIFSSATGVLARNGAVQNYHNAFASIYEGRYIAGFAAGKYLEKIHASDAVLSDPFNVGYVGAWDYAEVISGYTSWFLGLKQGLAENHRNNANMVVRYTWSWYDESAEKNTAETLITENNCILISQHADSMGAPNACLDHDIPNVSYNVPLSGDYNDVYVSCSKINWHPYYESVVKNTFEGRAIDDSDRNWTGTMRDYAVQCEFNTNKFTTQEMTEISNEAIAISDGEKHVFDTNNFTVTVDPTTQRNVGKKIILSSGATGKLTSYFADVTGDYIPDEDFQMIDNGNVRESYYRSAPSFDLIIDGITEYK